MTVRDIYEYINTIAPFSSQDSFDNSGLLVGNPDADVHRIAVCLDITNEVVDEAAKLGVSLIISHHPVIFNPLKNVLVGNPVYSLISSGISAICAHTNLDMAASGSVTDLMLELLDIKGSEVLEVVNSDGTGYGRVAELTFDTTARCLAEMCKTAFDCQQVRYSDAGSTIKKVALCSGAGNSVIAAALSKGCDALITGDIKWSSFVEAQNKGLSVIDAGHFHTENIMSSYLASLIEQQFPLVDVFVPDSNTDICRYV